MPKVTIEIEEETRDRFIHMLVNHPKYMGTGEGYTHVIDTLVKNEWASIETIGEKEPYVEGFDAQRQEAEESIFTELIHSDLLDEHTAENLSRSILRLILARFRSDLFLRE